MKLNRKTIFCALFLTFSSANGAYALFGFGDVVYDPANYAQNVITAARSLEQINNQIQQLTNQTNMLINQAKNLINLPNSIAGNLQSSLRQIDGLIREAEGLAYDVGAIEDQFQQLFTQQYGPDVSNSQIVQDAEDIWDLAREGFKHSLEVQAEVVTQVRADSVLLDQLVASSQGAVGNLQAVQAGNQLTALAAKQSMQLQTLLAAWARADALQEASALAAHEQGHARFTNFLGSGSAYTPR